MRFAVGVLGGLACVALLAFTQPQREPTLTRVSVCQNCLPLMARCNRNEECCSLYCAQLNDPAPVCHSR